MHFKTNKQTKNKNTIFIDVLWRVPEYFWCCVTVRDWDPTKKNTEHTSKNSFNKWTKISSFEITIFDLKMMVKSGLEFFILKFTESLQRYLLTCQANSAILGRYFCTGQQQLWRGSVNFRIKSLDHFLPSSLSKKW